MRDIFYIYINDYSILLEIFFLMFVFFFVLFKCLSYKYNQVRFFFVLLKCLSYKYDQVRLNVYNFGVLCICNMYGSFCINRDNKVNIVKIVLL